MSPAQSGAGGRGWIPAPPPGNFPGKFSPAPGRARPKLLIDGLFGIGLNRPLDGAWKTLIDTVNQSGLPVLSVDVPSGLNADNGQVEGAAIRADVTLTVGAPKRGLLQAAEWVGRLEVAPDIGLIPCPFDGRIELDVAGRFRRAGRRAGPWKATREPLAMSPSSRAAAVIMARRCWRRAARCGRNRDW